MLDSMLFYVFAGAAVLSAVAVITRRNAIHSALFLLITLLATAGIFLQLRAEFLFATQILLYAGGVVALLIYVIIFLGQDKAPLPMRLGTREVVALLTVSALGLLAAGILLAARRLPGGGLFISTVEDAQKIPPNAEELAKGLFGNYLLAFEITAVLLLVAMVGAVVITHNGKSAGKL